MDVFFNPGKLLIQIFRGIFFGLPWQPTQKAMGSYKVPPVRELTRQLMQQIYELARHAQLESLGNDCLEPPETPLEAGWDSTQRSPISTRSATGEGLATRTTAPAGSGRGER